MERSVYMTCSTASVGSRNREEISMTRREAREHTFKMLFARDFYEAGEWQKQAENYLELLNSEDGQAVLTDEEKAALMSRVLDICSKGEELDAEINAATEGWTTKRMAKVDLTIIRLALYEIRHDDSVPIKVAINEAVEIAKKFGGDDSPSFINGVLARLVKES